MPLLLLYTEQDSVKRKSVEGRKNVTARKCIHYSGI